MKYLYISLLQKCDIFACENNMLSSHVKISSLWLDSLMETSCVKEVFFSLIIIQQTEHYMVAWRCKFYLPVLKISHLWEIISTLEDEIGISAHPCNILYLHQLECLIKICTTFFFLFWLDWSPVAI